MNTLKLHDGRSNRKNKVQFNTKQKAPYDVKQFPNVAGSLLDDNIMMSQSDDIIFTARNEVGAR